MPAIRIPVQFPYVTYNVSPERVQVNIANQFPQIGVFLADYGFVPILKEVPVTFVAAIETDSISVSSLLIRRESGTVPVAKRK